MPTQPMAGRNLELTPRLYDYLLANSLRETDVQRALREETAPMRHGGMQIGPDQGQFMALLVKLTGARRAIEIGVFTGYSALAVALAMPDDGRMVACDLSEEWTDIARRYWERAGVAHKIDLRLAAAERTLDKLIGEGGAGSYDFAFIDADKGGYKRYYEQCLTLLRANGLIAVDNTLWSGAVADPKNQEGDTKALREFNAFVHRDERVDVSLLAIGDGVTLIRKR